MKRRYEVVGFARIAKAQLKKHPAADLPIGDDDKAALRGSIEERGLIQPLLVLDEPDTLDGMFLVVDGCNRLDSAPADAELPCVMIQTDDPRAVALECLGTGRRRSTGQRIMAFLMMNRRDVLKAAELGAEIASGGRNPHVAVSRETARYIGVLEHFSADAIAERLKVSKPDVVRAVELFRCLELGLHPEIEKGDGDTPERPLDMGDEEDKRAAATTEKVFNDVLAGGTPVRKWKASWNGRKHTTGPKGRPVLNYAKLAKTAMNHLLTVFRAKAWHDISPYQRDEIVKKWSEVIYKLPEELRVRLPKGDEK